MTPLVVMFQFVPRNIEQCDAAGDVAGDAAGDAAGDDTATKE